MNCSPTIAIALLLLSLSAGMWLLYKTQKENLNAFFKVIAWFVIVASLGSMVCCGLRCAMHCCMQKQECRGMEQCDMNMGKCGMGHGMGMMHGEKCIIICKEGNEECEMGMGECKEGKGECKEGKEECEEGKMDCCKKGEKHECEKKMECKKDSMMKKK